MDGMDSFIFSLVLVPALRDVLPSSGIAATTANVGYYSGLLFALFMVGWGVALVWGPIADRFGRARTLMFSILWFSLFTLLAALVPQRVVARDCPISGGRGHRRRMVHRRVAGIGRMAGDGAAPGAYV